MDSDREANALLLWGEDISQENKTRLKNGEEFLLLDQNKTPYAFVRMDYYGVIRQIRVSEPKEIAMENTVCRIERLRLSAKDQEDKLRPRPWAGNPVQLATLRLHFCGHARLIAHCIGHLITFCGSWFTFDPVPEIGCDLTIQAADAALIEKHIRNAMHTFHLDPGEENT